MHDPLLGYVPKPGGVSREGSFDRDGFRTTSSVLPPNAGLVVFEHTGFNQRDKEIAYVVRTGLMRKRPA